MTRLNYDGERKCFDLSEMERYKDENGNLTTSGRNFINNSNILTKEVIFKKKNYPLSLQSQFEKVLKCERKKIEEISQHLNKKDFYEYWNRTYFVFNKFSTFTNYIKIYKLKYKKERIKKCKYE
ncbi:MAG: hypothetical protein RLZZ577_54 [Bacteroidota bacterium]|jgi:hypothetical protein